MAGRQLLPVTPQADFPAWCSDPVRTRCLPSRRIAWFGSKERCRPRL